MINNQNLSELEEISNLLPSDYIPIFQTRLEYDANAGNTIMYSGTRKTTLQNLLNQQLTLRDGNSYDSAR